MHDQLATIRAAAQQDAVRVHIRWLIARDLPDVLEIEDLAFQWHAWTEQQFKDALRQRSCIGMVAEAGDTTLGYMVYELHAHHLAILNFAVHPNCRRLGVGRQMVEKLVDKLSAHRRRHICLTLSEANLGAQLFFQHMGFKAVGVRRGYYADAEQDGYRLRYDLFPE